MCFELDSIYVKISNWVNGIYRRIFIKEGVAMITFLMIINDVEIREKLEEITLDESIIKVENSKEMANELSNLHKPYADVIMMKFYYELLILEIAEILNITENNVSVRINRALKALKCILEKRSGSLEKIN